MHVPVLIIGAGPAGLACAKVLAENGIKTLVIEKNWAIGPKVCAGGLTWGGLARSIPAHLIEQSFPIQHISTARQRITVRSSHPIIVTVNRENLGRFMLEQAQTAGAEVLPGTRVTDISGNTLTCRKLQERREQRIRFDYLVGADGSHSLVRRRLGLPCMHKGIGINYQLPGRWEKMEWHLDGARFKNGYGWIFPHRDTCSIGAYADAAVITAPMLKEQLIRWAAEQGIVLVGKHCDAQFIAFDYRGWNFGNVFLAGDAAGLTSALTGEGINPAVISGETIARTIIDPHHDCAPITTLVAKQKAHARLVHMTGKCSLFNTLFSELAVLGLRCGLLPFRLLEMTG